MAGYEDTKRMIIDTLMGRDPGTEIMPENHQAFALNMLDYIRSVEMSSASTLIGIAEGDTTPIQPDNARVAYIAGVAQERTVTFVNFHDINGQPISITTGEMEAVFVILLWNTAYWEYQITNANIISAAENANFRYYLNMRKTYASVAAMNADVDSHIADDGTLIRVGETVAVHNTSNPSENAIYSLRVTSNGVYYWQEQATLPALDISGMFNQINANVNYLECSQNAEDEIKIISDIYFSLSTHMRFLVKMTNTNTHPTPKLNINSTGAKSIWYNGAPATNVNTWNAEEILDIYFDGINYIAITFSNVKHIPGTNSDSVMSQKGVTDLVSEYNVSTNNNNAEYTFTQAVSLVPASLQKGGLTIKYIDSTTHEYVIKRLMSSTWNTTESNWQGIDTKPTANSSNLVKSGGVYDAFASMITASNVKFDQPEFNLQKGLYPPQNQIDFWNVVDYENGIINNSGNLVIISGYKTIKYDISRFVGDTLTLFIQGTVDSYASTWPICIIVKEDDSVEAIHANLPSTPYGPVVTTYTVQENDKYMKVSAACAIFLMRGINFSQGSLTKPHVISPILKPSAAEVRAILESSIEDVLEQVIQYCEYTNPQMFDLNSEDVQENKYISSIQNGEVVWTNLNGINESGYIPVTPGMKLYKTDFDQDDNIIRTRWGYLAVCLFDENKNPIQTILNPSTLGYVNIPSGTHFIRFSYENTHKIVISKNTNVTQYYEYLTPGYTIKDRIEDVNNNLQNQIDGINGDIEDINQRIADITGDGSQWIGKTWYAYGTSITSTIQGKYVPYLAAMSQMNVVNKGIAGGGIGDLGGYSHGQVRTAIMNITDGKLNADLITLEVGANDTGSSVPLGTIYDTDETTLCGCLNMCIRYLQQNTNAQIVIMPSPAMTTIPSAAGKYYEAMWLFKQVCFINKCWWIDGMTNLGTAKIARTDIRYVQDNIHQTELGGYVFAKAIWAELKRIPTFDTVLPN